MKHYGRPLVQLALVLTLAAGMGACSTISDLDPTGIFSDDDTAPLPADAAPTAQSDTDVNTPDLAALPPKPPTASADQQAQTAQAVTSAGAQAQYSADALRAGTEAAAPPPGPAGQPVASAAPDTAPSADLPPTADDNAPPTARSAPAAAPAAAPLPPPTVVAAAAPPPQPAPAAPEPAPTASAPAAAPAMTAPAGAQPAISPGPVTANGAVAVPVQPSDAALGFKPSTAPALNPSINQWVSAPILAHYRETAALAGTPGTSSAAATGGRAVGGPDMSGDVVANLDAAPGTPAGMSAAMNGGVSPTAVIYFPGDGTILSGKARTQVREAVMAYKATGGGATIKVVGHASSRTANMPVERHLEAIFNKSQQRANVVAQALIKAGVPASKVIVEAVGDSQPIYYESMPRGEDGNRRAEIFVQG